MPVPLTPSMTGYVDVTSIGLVGAWFTYGDGLGANGAPPGQCETTGMHTTAQCSSVTSPPGPPADGGPASFPPNATGGICLSGTAAQIIGTPPDYSNIFGIGMGLNLNNPMGTVMTYNAVAAHVTGFTFTVSGLPAGSVLVELHEPGTDVPPEDAWSYPITSNGQVTVQLQVGSGPGELSQSFATTYPVGPVLSQPPFDPTMLEAMDFHVVPSTSAPITVSNFCISDLQAIVCQ